MLQQFVAGSESFTTVLIAGHPIAHIRRRRRRRLVILLVEFGGIRWGSQKLRYSRMMIGTGQRVGQIGEHADLSGGGGGRSRHRRMQTGVEKRRRQVRIHPDGRGEILRCVSGALGAPDRTRPGRRRARFAKRIRARSGRRYQGRRRRHAAEAGKLHDTVGWQGESATATAAAAAVGQRQTDRRRCRGQQVLEHGRSGQGQRLGGRCRVLFFFRRRRRTRQHRIWLAKTNTRRRHSRKSGLCELLSDRGDYAAAADDDDDDDGDRPTVATVDLHHWWWYIEKHRRIC
ncbi:LigA protein [Trichinella spiralis]|uniref:LigA protein n=1 Tax=Trichinella spiralis TaxID=6334 RepID=UPI0001EFC380|nr:LigA protein [Trichinella spiralis]